MEDLTQAYADIITSALSDSLTPIKNSIATLASQQEHTANTVVWLLLLVSMLIITMTVVVIALFNQNKKLRELSKNSDVINNHSKTF